MISVLLTRAGISEDETCRIKGNIGGSTSTWHLEREGCRAPGFRRQSWEDRHVRATYWLDRGLREEVRREAEGRGWSVSQFVSWALRRALDKGR